MEIYEILKVHPKQLTICTDYKNEIIVFAPQIMLSLTGKELRVCKTKASLTLTQLRQVKNILLKIKKEQDAIRG